MWDFEPTLLSVYVEKRHFRPEKNLQLVPNWQGEPTAACQAASCCHYRCSEPHMEIKYGAIWYPRHICVCHFFFGQCVEVSGAATLLFLKVTSMFLSTPKVRDPGLSNQLLKVTPTHPALSLLAAMIACHTDSLAPRKPHEIPTLSTPGLFSEERDGLSWGWQSTAGLPGRDGW